MKLRDIEKYAIREEVFYKMTGMLAPGKDEPLGSYESEKKEALKDQAWKVFKATYFECVDATIEAFTEVMGLEIEQEKEEKDAG